MYKNTHQLYRELTWPVNRLLLAALERTALQCSVEDAQDCLSCVLQDSLLLEGPIDYARLHALLRKDLSGHHLAGEDFSGMYLAHFNLSNANLSRANLSRANLSNADLHWANLQRANLFAASMPFCDLVKADLEGADLSGCLLHATYFGQQLRYDAETKIGANDRDLISMVLLT